MPLRFLTGLLPLLALPVLSATGSLQDVQHVVILCLENRSFDHYYGSLAGVRGFNDPNSLVFSNGNSAFYQPVSGGYVLPFLSSTQCVADVDHGWPGEHASWDNGKWDRWALSSPQVMVCFDRSTLPFYYALSEAYTICDAYFCSVIGPTQPNRLYQFTGMIDPRATGGGPVTDNNSPPGGFTWTTYPERLQANGITWKVYQQDYWLGNPLTAFAQYKQALPGNPLYDRGIAPVADVVAAFAADVSNGTLPQVSWVVPSWAGSDHPAIAPSAGQFFVHQIFAALFSNPAVYNKTVLLVTYDENGGFFDHVPPPVAPPGTADEFVSGLPIGLGPRVPMLIISPWSRGGFVCSEVFDHTSILRFLEAWTGVQEPNISAWRRQVCGNLLSAFDFTNPDTNAPSLPWVAPITCYIGFVVPVPSPQTFPVQEPGVRPARPLAYQPDASCIADCAAGWFRILMTNSGCASVHYAVYPNAYRVDGAWQYDVVPFGSAAAAFEVVTNAAGLYDFSCYGPNGFQRRFAGDLSTQCGQVEAVANLTPSSGTLTLAMTNGLQSTITFAVTNGYPSGGPWVYIVPAGQTAVDSYPVATLNNGWYDLTVTADSASGFLRRFAGHLETGSAPASIQSGPPPLSATLQGTNLVLSCPAWAVPSYVLESTNDLDQNTWSTVTADLAVLCDQATFTVPSAPGSAFFRLRQ